jgi:hypothetical protein
MGLHGKVFDAVTGEPVAATVRVLGGSGHAVVPSHVIRRIGTGNPSFYCDGEFNLVERSISNLT